MRPTSSTALILICIGCSEGSVGGMAETRHPVLSVVEGELTISDSVRSLAGLEQLQKRLAAARRSVTFGTLDGPPETVFGRLVDGAVTAWGELLVLDAQAAEIRTFDTKGKYIRTLVAKGEGPSEIINPLALGFLPPTEGASRNSSQRLLVTTRSRVKIFQLTRDSIYLERTFTPPEIPFPADACAAGNRIVVRATYAAGEELVSSIDLVTGETKRFGEGYKHGSALARESMSQGPISCSDSGDVVIGFTRLPTLTMLNASTGAVRWRAALPNFQPLTSWERVRDGQLRFAHSMREAGDLLHMLKTVPGGSVVVQILNLAAGSRRSNRLIQDIKRRATYLISAATGEGVLVSESFPRILAIDDRMIWTEDYAPEGYPIVVGFSY